MNRSLTKTSSWVVAGAVVALVLTCGSYLMAPLFLSDARPGSADVRQQVSESASALATTEVSFPGLSSGRPAGEPPPDLTPITLTDATGPSRIAFRHTHGGSGRRYIVEAMSAGLATFDYDNDGLIDVYFVNGAPLPGARQDVAARNALYRNLGDFQFEDVTERAGVGDTRFGMAVAAADYDNDGRLDLYVNNFGPNVLYHNRPDGTFEDVTERAGVQPDNENLVGAGTCFLDADADGDLDLYCANYMQFTFDRHMIGNRGGFPSSPSPGFYEPVPDCFFQNRGDGTFDDASQTSGIGRCAGRSMGMVSADYDGDGDTDIFVCNDLQPNFLFQNDGSGTFEEVACFAGVAFSGNGDVLSNMGVDVGDYDNDGRLDFFSTNYRGTLPVLFRNMGQGFFVDETVLANAGAGCLQHVNWGCGLVDLNNDGHRDLFVANGHSEDNIHLSDPTAAYRASPVVLMNTGKGRFIDVSRNAGDGLGREAAGRGTTFDDLDNDGDVDVIVLNSCDSPSILRNMLVESGCSNHWLQVRLRGTHSNRNGVGAQVRVLAGDLRQLDEVCSGRGYQSHRSSRLHFGLGHHDRVDRIEVRWIGGGVDILENVNVDQLLIITEGTHRRP